MTQSKLLSLVHKLYIYQEKRFPLVFLVLSILPVILSSAVIVAHVTPNPFRVLIALIASLIFFFHIRVNDDCRDFDHDCLYHKDRPVQNGTISLSDLKNIDLILIGIFIVISIFQGIHSFGLAIFLLIYAYFAKKDFFVAKTIRKYFYVYNLINLFQMLVLQAYIYIFFSQNLQLNLFLAIHFVFIATGTIIFEFLRKLKVPDQEGQGKDTYSWHMGFGRSILFYLFLIAVNSFLFFTLAVSISSQISIWLLSSLLFIMVTLIFAYAYWIKRNTTTNNLLQFVSLLGYVFFNMIIYFIRFKIS